MSTTPATDLTAARLAEIRDGGELGVDGPPPEPAIVEVIARLQCVLQMV